MRPAVAGILLAAGAGTRMGRPKALVDHWLADSVAVLREGGCDPVLVVLGAEADRAAALLGDPEAVPEADPAADPETGPAVNPEVDDGVAVVIAADWADGMGASLQAGLVALRARDLPDTEAALIHLVDLPDVGADVVARLIEHTDRNALARATYRGSPGHPVLLGREHWTAVADSVHGDRGARDYLESHAATGVECGDLADGLDVDTPVDRTD